MSIAGAESIRVSRVGRERATDLAAIHGRVFSSSWGAADMDSFLAHPGACALVAERGPEAIGFILGRIAADEAEILTLAVAPNERRRGAGRTLVGSLIDLLRHERVTCLILEVAASNQAALGLYRGLGFGEVGRRSAYYPCAGAAFDDAVVMARVLAAPIVI